MCRQNIEIFSVPFQKEGTRNPTEMVVKNFSYKNCFVVISGFINTRNICARAFVFLENYIAHILRENNTQFHLLIIQYYHYWVCIYNSKSKRSMYMCI